VAIVVLFGFFVLGLLAYRTYQDDPPIPSRVIDPSGRVVFTGEWLRFPGDVLFIVGGVLPLLYLCWLGVRYTVRRMTLEEPEEILFAEVTEPAAESAGQA
jgi:nitric oxide reductase large subunit